MSSTPNQSSKAATAAVEPVHRPDAYIWGSFIGLVIISVIELFSASSQEVHAGNIYGPILRHVGFLGLGFLVMLYMQRTHFVKLFDKWIPWFVVASILMMIYVMFFGVKINGARRGLDIFVAIILPAEFLKLGVGLGVAWILSYYQVRDENGNPDVSTRGVVYSAALVLLSSGLLFSQGLTNTLLLMCISIGMMLLSGVSVKKMLCVGLVYGVIGCSAFGVKVMMARNAEATPEELELAEINGTNVNATANGNRSSVWLKRLEHHFDLHKYRRNITDDNKQEMYSYIAQARGGVTGVGVGNSRENARLPLAFSDYIFAIVVEELGLVFGLIVLALYLFLMGRAGRLAMVFSSTPPCLMVIGCALVICLQALFHICIVVGVFPVSGQPLPLISKGGTSILATCFAMGFMLSAARWAARISDDEETVRQELNTLPENIASNNPAHL